MYDQEYNPGTKEEIVRIERFQAEQIWYHIINEIKVYRVALLIGQTTLLIWDPLNYNESPVEVQGVPRNMTVGE